MAADMKALTVAGINSAAANTSAASDGGAATGLEKIFADMLPKLAQASLAGIKPEFLISTAMTVLRGNDALRKCSPLSIVHCVIQGAQSGLRLDPVFQHAALVPRKGQAQFVPMYRGLLHLSRRSQQLRHVAAQPVYSNDQFAYEYGLNQSLTHKPTLKAQKGEITHYYAYFMLTNGGFQFEVMTAEEIEEVKKAALEDKYNKAVSPWNTNPIPMALKTVLRRALKLAPVEDPMLAAALQADEMYEDGVMQKHGISNGLVVPMGTYSDDPEVAPVEETKVEEVKEDPPAAPEKTDEQKKHEEKVAWMQAAQAAIEACHKKGDHDQARSWGATARKKLECGEITEFDMDVILTVYRKFYPPAPKTPVAQPKPAPAPAADTATGLFNQSGDPVAPAADQPKADPPKAEPKKKAAKKKPVEIAEQLYAQLDEAGKMSVLFTLKGRIEKADLPEDVRADLMSKLNAKLAQLKKGS